MRGTAAGVEVKLDPPRRQPPQRIVLHLPKSRPLLKAPKGVHVVYRPDQARRWDFPAVVEAYRNLPAPPLILDKVEPRGRERRPRNGQCVPLNAWANRRACG